MPTVDDVIAAVITPTVDDAQQYGKAGMKWGVRHIPATKEQARAHAAAQKEINKTGLKSLNASPKYAGKDLTKNPALMKKYNADAEKLFSAAYASHLGHQASRTATRGKTRVDASVSLLNASLRLAVDILAQADDADGADKIFELTLIRGDLGHIESVVDESFAHSWEICDEEYTISHSGVKGMRWGVRRKVDSSTGLVARTSSADQIHADRIASKIKSGGTGAVSNRDLKDYAARIAAEQEFNRAARSEEATKGQNFVSKFLKQQGTRQFNRVADKAIDIAVEKALREVGVQVTKKGKAGLAGDLNEIAERITPKKKKK